ncbi:DMT family transporter [Lacibacterium aquatile]|uniref:DMT family transporter n=1 Tax=Lacibacterium aquatile TaxID=1168082 RepID=A0ABW5DLC7_9PROT
MGSETRAVEMRAGLAFGLAMCVSGTLGVMVVEAGTDPVTTVFWRCALALPVILLYAAWRGLLKPPFPPLKLWLLAGLSGALFVGDWIALFAAYCLIPVGLATITLNLYPFITLGLAAVVLRERPGWNALGWIVIAFGGFLLATGLLGLGGTWDPLGIILSLVAAVFYAAATLVGRFLKAMPALLTTLVQMSVGVLSLGLFIAPVGGMPETSWFWLAAMALGPTAGSYVLMNLAFGRARMAVIAVLSFVYPVVTAVLDALVYGRVLTPLQILGFLLIAGASLAVTFRWPLNPFSSRRQPEAAG